MRTRHASALLTILFLLLWKKTKIPKLSHLLDILIATRDRDTSDARDIIFGILSIIQRIDETKFPDLKVESSMSMQKVYASFSSFLIPQHGNSVFPVSD